MDDTGERSNGCWALWMPGLAFLLGLALAAPAGPRAQAPTAEAHTAETPTAEVPTVGNPAQHALLVGCTTYDNHAGRALKGCGNDAQLMAKLFSELLGIEDIQLLTETSGTRPTRAHILAGLERLVSRTGKGELAFLFLAGHGSQQPDQRSGGDEADGYDEVFLPCDTGRTRRRRGREVIENAITDDEIFTYVERLLAKGARVRLFTDACHSATLMRGNEVDGNTVRARGIRPEDLGIERAASKSRGERTSSQPGDARPGDGDFVALYAVQSEEQALEQPVDVGTGEQRMHGVFTWSLARAITRTGGDATFDDLYRHVVSGYREFGHHTIHPFLQGRRSTALKPGDSGRSSAVFARWTESRIEIDGGLLHGIQPGSRLAVRDATGRRRLGALEVAAASALRASCAKPTSGALAAQTAGTLLPVYVEETPSGAHPLRLHVEGTPDWLPALRKEDPSGSRIQPVDDPGAADWRASPTPAGFWRIHHASDGRAFRFATDDVVRSLLQIQRVEMLLRTAARMAPLPPKLEFTALRDGKPLPPGTTLRPGERLTLRLFNRDAVPRDVWIFWIDAQQGVQQLFPEADIEASSSVSAAGRTSSRAYDKRPIELEVDLYDATQGVEHLLALSVPRGTSDLGFLATDALLSSTRGEDLKGQSAVVLDELAYGPKEGRTYTHGLGADMAAQLLPMTIAWNAREPSGALDWRDLERKAADDRAAVDQAAKAPAAPWPNGTSVVVHEEKWTFENDPRRIRVVADRREKPTRVLLDLDAEPDLDDETLARALAAGTYEAELALVFDPESGARHAFYDLDGGGFDLQLTDRDGDGRCDAARRRGRDGNWEPREVAGEPWLRTATLDFQLLAPRPAPYAGYDLEERTLALLNRLFPLTGN